MSGENIKQKICDKAFDLGINLIRSCSATKWEGIPIQAPEFWSTNIWPWVKNIIVLGIPLYSPMMSTTPSMVYQELYDTSNRVLDDMAYRLTNYIVKNLVPVCVLYQSSQMHQFRRMICWKKIYTFTAKNA